MTNPNDTIRTIIRQFRALGPRDIAVSGPGRPARAFFRQRAAFDNDTLTAHFDYIGPQRGVALFPDLLRVSVTYDRGPDLYIVRVVFVDGLELGEPVQLLAWDRVFVEGLGELPTRYDLPAAPEVADVGTFSCPRQTGAA